MFTSVLAIPPHAPYSLRVRRIARLLILVGCLLVAGCAHSPPKPKISLLPPDLVLVARIGTADVRPRAAGCPLQTLDQTPSAIIRDLGSIELAGSVPAGKDVLAAVDQKACESGADAIVVKQREERSAGDRVEYHIVAEALLLHRPAPAEQPAAEASATAEAPSPGPTLSAGESGPSEVALPHAEDSIPSVPAYARESSRSKLVTRERTCIGS